MKKKLSHRLDYFIIWPNGLDYCFEILDFIAEKDFEILHIETYKFRSMNKFLRLIYSHDYAPFIHLKSKLKYLKKLKDNKVIIIFVLNKNSRSFIQNKSGTPHVESLSMNEIKWELRKMFNKRDENNLIDNNHIIHGTDSESQTIYLLKKLRINPERILRNDQIFPSHLAEFENYKIQNVNLEEIKVRILKSNNIELMKIKNSPHYKYLKGNEDVYLNYLDSNIGKGIKKYHSPIKFKNLFKEFNENLKSYRPIILNHNFEIYDGNHRASIMYFKGYKTINAIIKNEE